MKVYDAAHGSHLSAAELVSPPFSGAGTMAVGKVRQPRWLLTCCWLGFWAQSCSSPAGAARGVLQAPEAAASAEAGPVPVPTDPRHFRSQVSGLV